MKNFPLLALILALIMSAVAQTAFADPILPVVLARETSDGQYRLLPSDDNKVPQVTIGDKISVEFTNQNKEEIQWFNAPANAGTFSLSQLGEYWYPKTAGLADIYTLVNTISPFTSYAVSNRILVLPENSPRLEVSSLFDDFPGHSQLTTKITNTGGSTATNLSFKMRQDGAKTYTVANSGAVFGQADVSGLTYIYAVGTWFQIGSGGWQRLAIDPFVASVPIGNLAVGQTATVKFNLLDKVIPIKMTTSIAPASWPPECQTAQIGFYSGSIMTAKNVQITTALVGNTLNISALANGITIKGKITIPTGYVYVVGSTVIKVQNSAGQWYYKNSPDLVGHSIIVGDVPGPSGIRVECNFMKEYSTSSLKITGYAAPQAPGSSTLVMSFQVMNPRYNTIAKGVTASITIDNYNHHINAKVQDLCGDVASICVQLPQNQACKIATTRFDYCIGGKWQFVNLDPTQDNQISLGDLVGLGSDSMQNSVTLSGTLVPIIQPTLSIVGSSSYADSIMAVTFVITNTGQSSAKNMEFATNIMSYTITGAPEIESQITITDCDYMGYSNPICLGASMTELPNSFYVSRNGVKTFVKDDYPPIAIGDLAPGETLIIGVSYEK